MDKHLVEFGKKNLTSTSKWGLCVDKDSPQPEWAFPRESIKFKESVQEKKMLSWL